MPSSRNEARDWLCYGTLKFFLGHPRRASGISGILLLLCGVLFLFLLQGSP